MICEKNMMDAVIYADETTVILMQFGATNIERWCTLIEMITKFACNKSTPASVGAFDGYYINTYMQKFWVFDFLIYSISIFAMKS